jgi:hypothetical protein
MKGMRATWLALLTLVPVSHGLADDQTLVLLGTEAAQITTTRIGIDGSGDKELARVLKVSSKPGRKLGGGLYAPSQMELAMHALLKKNRKFGQLSAMLNPDDEESPRGNGAFSVHLARTTVTEVEYLPGKRRRSYFIELGMSFTLADVRGRTVFATEVADYDVLHCFIEQGRTCIDNVSSRPFVLSGYWRSLLNKVTGKVLEETIIGLRRWDDLLRHLVARVVIKKYGETLELEKNAVYVRNKQLADYPYLFLEVPHVKDQNLINALKSRGIVLDRTQRELLTRYATSIFRNELDRQLRGRLEDYRSAKQAGIFIIPDREAAWFQDALARIVADAVNAGEYEIVITDEGAREELAEEIRDFGRMCDKRSARAKLDRCYEVRVVFGKARTKTAEGDLKGVTEATQNIIASGLLVDKHVQPDKDPRKDRFFPHSIKDPGMRIMTVATQSPAYLRVNTNKAGDNDDGIYLQQIALAAMIKLGRELSGNVIKTFHEGLLK